MPDLPYLDRIRSELDDRFVARETAVKRGRDIIRSSANAIRALHRRQMEIADERIRVAENVRDEVLAAVAEQPAMAQAGFVSDAMKELAEAHITRALFTDQPIPGPAELKIDPVPWLHGLGEAVGELRRRLLDELRAGAVDQAEGLLAAMDEIVDVLASLDYPDGMTNGLRRTTDVARSLTERSRADLTATVVQERLRTQLENRLR